MLPSRGAEIGDGIAERGFRMIFSRHQSFLKGRFTALSALALVGGILLLPSPSDASATDETVPPDSWVYPALRTLELAGLVHLDPSIPYSRSDVERYTRTVLEAVRGGADDPSPRIRFLIGRLEGEFLAADPRQRENHPLLVMTEERNLAALDVAAGALFVKTAEEEEGEVWGTARPRFLLGLGGMVTAETSYRLRMGPEEGANISSSKPNSRERSFRGLTSEFERGMIFLSGEGWRLGIGRDYIHWGSGRDEGLLMSKSAGSLDHLIARAEMGRFSLHAVHVILDPEIPRRLAGHRLSVRLPRGIRIGVGETVLYTARDLDFTYLLPFGSYYANQYNEEEDDNILWALDWKIPVTRGLILYGELLVDDIQYESDPPAPDRVGFNMTAEAYLDVGGREFELLLGYTYLDIYTYAHKDTLLTGYVTGDGDPETGSIIGSPLGPDADRWNLALATPLHPRLLVTARGSYSRRGEGNDLREWIRGTDPSPEFPSGDVAREARVSLEVDLDLEHGSYVRAGGGWVRCDEGGIEEDAGFFHLELVLDF